jgi:hypothetical protein
LRFIQPLTPCVACANTLPVTPKSTPATTIAARVQAEMAGIKGTA